MNDNDDDEGVYIFICSIVVGFIVGALTVVMIAVAIRDDRMAAALAQYCSVAQGQLIEDKEICVLPDGKVVEF